MGIEEEIQKKYIKAQLLKQQINSMIEEKSNIDEKIKELLISMNALAHLEESKKGGEIWSPLGGGAFVRSDIKDTETVMVGIGADIVAKKPLSRAVEILKGRLEELRQIDLKIMEQVTEQAHMVEELESEMQSLIEEHEKEEKKGKEKESRKERKA